MEGCGKAESGRRGERARVMKWRPWALRVGAWGGEETFDRSSLTSVGKLVDTTKGRKNTKVGLVSVDQVVDLTAL